jgi:hypothetical protein
MVVPVPFQIRKMKKMKTVKEIMLNNPKYCWDNNKRREFLVYGGIFVLCGIFIVGVFVCR